MRYIITAPMRQSGTIGLFYATSLGFETDETEPDAIMYVGIVAANQTGQELGHGQVFVLASTGEYVYPVGFNQNMKG